MAAGDFVFFNQALLDLGKKVHDLDADTFSIALVSGGTVPTKDTPVPHFGGLGTTNFATTQVGLGTAYTGPISLGDTTWALLGGEPTLSAGVDSVTVARDEATGFSNAAYGVVFNVTDPSKRAIGFFDFGGNKSNVGGPLILDFDAAASGVTNRIGKLVSML